ncbi:MAG: hypothetical protein AABZ78_16775 [Chloroflexota bacterium]
MKDDLRNRFNFWATFSLIVIATLAVLLAMPLDLMNLNPVILQLQTRIKDGLGSLTPFIAVGALGAAVGLAELTSTFEDYPREAIMTQWGQYLIWLNGGTAVLAFFITRFYAPAETNIFLLILMVGIGFPTLIRTNFTFAKQFGGDGKGDMGINLGWLYEQFQTLCKKQIDVELMTFRRKQVDRLLARYPTVLELYQTALYTIKARATFTKAEEETKLSELQQKIDPKFPIEAARTEIGLLILEVGGIAYVDLLVEARREAPTPVASAVAEASRGAAAPAAAVTAPVGGGLDSESVVKKLVEMPLDDLVSFGVSLLNASDDQDWVKKAAQPQGNITEVKQKAPIAYYLVSRLGVDAIVRALQNRNDSSADKS